MKNESIFLIGLANGLKPRIILETISKMPIWREKNFVYITDSEIGVSAEFCRTQGVKILIVNKDDIISSTRSIQEIREIKPYMLICIGWNKKIPDDFLRLFKKRVNCHGGLLPDYRGDKAYMHTYANIEEEYGTTIHFMNDKFDDGEILLQGKLKLYLDETPEIMHRRISEVAGMMIPEAIRLLEIGYKGTKQSGRARYFFKITREEMDTLRQKNIENLRKGLPKEISSHKAWDLL
jgi:phosphoribosylglycinamide formyltransferase-1